MKNIKIGMCVIIILIIAISILGGLKVTIARTKNVETVAINSYNFKVRSKATEDVYTAVSAKIDENDEMQIKIYNYYINKYEWYPIYKFYNYKGIAAYVNKKYAQEKFGVASAFIEYNEEN